MLNSIRDETTNRKISCTFMFSFLNYKLLLWHWICFFLLLSIIIVPHMPQSVYKCGRFPTAEDCYEMILKPAIIMGKKGLCLLTTAGFLNVPKRFVCQISSHMPGKMIAKPSGSLLLFFFLLYFSFHKIYKLENEFYINTVVLATFIIVYHLNSSNSN